jgi:hypothetical protein
MAEYCSFVDAMRMLFHFVLGHKMNSVNYVECNCEWRHCESILAQFLKKFLIILYSFYF